MKSYLKNPTYIDLFCGAGGFSLGFEKNNFDNIFSLDCEVNFSKTYASNFPKHNLIIKKIEDLKKKEIFHALKGKKVDVIIGGPPCQGFSIAGNIGRKFIDDPRNYLFKEFVRIVSVVKPEFFVMENVQRLFTNEIIRHEIVLSLESLGYNLDCKVLNASEYDVPQHRRRVFFIGRIGNKKIEFPEPSIKKPKSVLEAIGSLPKLKSGESSSVRNHEAMNHTKSMLKKMSFIGDGKGREEIPIKLRPTSGDVRKYIRYDSSKPSICITGDMRKVFHYSQNRALTVRELARLQTFPDNFEFLGPKISQQQQVGNAVPPALSEKIAKTIKKMINDD